jgi:hypothetical protein
MKHIQLAAIIAVAATLAFTAPAHSRFLKGDKDKGAKSSQTQDVQSMIESWPESSKAAYQEIVGKYGQPTEVTDSHLVWQKKGNWQKIVLFKEPVKHNFPMQHEDVLAQTISYSVPAEKLEQLSKFDSSLVVDRTAGLLTAKCDKEAHNILALNIANDIVTGKRDVEDARKFLADTAAQSMAGKSSPYAEKLQFSIKGDTAFADEQMLRGTEGKTEGMTQPDGSNPSQPQGQTPPQTQDQNPQNQNSPK